MRRLDCLLFGYNAAGTLLVLVVDLLTDAAALELLILLVLILHLHHGLRNDLGMRD